MSGAENKARGTVQKAKLVIKDIGNPKKGADTDTYSATKPYILGVIKGKAFGTKIKVDPKGEAFEALVGFFVGEPADPNVDMVAAGMCYLPGGFHEMIVEQLRGRANTEVQFAYEVATVPDSNPIGYSYRFRPILSAQAHSLLSIGADAGAGFVTQERPNVAEKVSETQKHLEPTHAEAKKK